MIERIRGVDIHYEEVGAGASVLFVHGFPLDGTMWEPTLTRMGSGVRCIVPDLRGMGRSEGSAAAAMADYADDLAALLERLGVGRPLPVVALSMGGYVAFELLRRHPLRVSAAVLVSTRTQPDPPQAREGRHATSERLLREGSSFLADEMVGKLFSASAPEALRAAWRERIAAAPPVGLAAASRAMASRPDSRPTLEGFEGPVLIVMGEDDVITPVADGERMRDMAPAARLEVIPGTGHMVPVEAPERFAAILREFLAELP
jgi:3-oxoadipate enol-lactonase